MKKEKIKVVQSESDPVSAEILASSIKRLGDAIDNFSKAGLTDRAIVTLLKDVSGVSKGEIEKVIWGMRNIEKFCLRNWKQTR